jgi:beta-ribofuranosylaminobenzene 5'-phosphate synthase
MSTSKNYGASAIPKVRVRVIAPARLHIGLISMHLNGPRKNGGIGFAIESPNAVVGVAPSSRVVVRDERLVRLDSSELDLLTQSVDQIVRENRLVPAEIIISGSIQTHVGMGSKTAIQLSIVEALCVLSGHPLSRSRLIKMSGRGGTSGVGVSSYFSGGMILDLGQLNELYPVLLTLA